MHQSCPGGGHRGIGGRGPWAGARSWGQGAGGRNRGCREVRSLPPIGPPPGLGLPRRWALRHQKFGKQTGRPPVARPRARALGPPARYPWPPAPRLSLAPSPKARNAKGDQSRSNAHPDVPSGRPASGSRPPGTGLRSTIKRPEVGPGAISYGVRGQPENHLFNAIVSQVSVVR